MTETIVLTAEMVAVMAILALTIFLFAFEIVRVDVAAVGIMVLLGLTSMLPGYSGLVPIGNLFDGFSSNAVIGYDKPERHRATPPPSLRAAEEKRGNYSQRRRTEAPNDQRFGKVVAAALARSASRSCETHGRAFDTGPCLL